MKKILTFLAGFLLALTLSIIWNEKQKENTRERIYEIAGEGDEGTEVAGYVVDGIPLESY